MMLIIALNIGIQSRFEIMNTQIIENERMNSVRSKEWDERDQRVQGFIGIALQYQ